MSRFQFWYRNDDGDQVEITDQIQAGWSENPGTDGLVMNAEEGTIGISTVTLEDPASTFTVRGHRKFYVTETACAGDAYDGQVYVGYTANRKVSRGTNQNGELGRTWQIDLVDINTVFDRRLMEGAENNRPAETDVERITWLLTTNEAALIDDDQYFSSDNPFDMDAVDYRGQSFRNIIDDCAQQSGKNYYIWPSANGYSLWYGPKGTTTFSSQVKITNDLALVSAGGSNTFPPSRDTVLTRDPSRVFSGVHVSYAAAHVYVQNDDIAEDFARRDVVSPAPNVKTKRQASIRANRYLSDNDTEEDVISTAIIVPRAQANDLYQGQRCQVLFTHLPGYEDWVWCRVLNRTVREVNEDYIELSMELTNDEDLADVAPGSNVFGILVRPKGYDAGQGTAIPGLDKVWYDWVGDYPDTGGGTMPTVGLIEALYDESGPLAPTWIYYGWQMLGDGTVDIRWRCSTISITPESVSFIILVNGVAVSTTTQENFGNGNDCDIIVTGLPVSTGDIITTSLVFNPPDTPFSQAPRGVGSNGEYFCITGGSLF